MTSALGGIQIRHTVRAAVSRAWETPFMVGSPPTVPVSESCMKVGLQEESLGCGSTSHHLSCTIGLAS